MYIRDSGKFLRTPCSNPVFEWHVRVRQRLAMQMFKSVSLSVICMCVATDYQIDSSTSPVLSFALASGKDDAEHPVTEMESATAEPCPGEKSFGLVYLLCWRCGKWEDSTIARLPAKNSRPAVQQIQHTIRPELRWVQSFPHVNDIQLPGKQNRPVYKTAVENTKE